MAAAARTHLVQPLVSLRAFAAPGGGVLPQAAHLRCMFGRRAAAAAGGGGGDADAAAPDADASAASDAPLAPGLYLVATPIGNLEDVTLRAVRVLRRADALLCEDTRRTGALLSALGVPARGRLESFHAHNEHGRGAGALARLRGGAALALVSDAGVPLVSDPGAALAAAAAAAGVPVVPVPGPSAVLAALVGSGLPPAPFTFHGFLEAKPAGRRRQLEAAAASPATAVFFVSPHALVRALREAADVLGPGRRCCLARELTKVHEEFWRGTLAAAADEFEARGARGEFTLVVDGAPAAGGGGGGAATDAEVAAALRAEVAAGAPPSRAARDVAERLGVPKRRVYGLSLRLDAAAGDPP